MAEENQAHQKKAQEIYMEFNALDRHIKQLERQLELVAHQLIELNAARGSLDEMAKVNLEKDVFVPLSPGIFAKANIRDASELLVSIGANVAVKKDIASTKRLVQSQMEELKKIQSQMLQELEKSASRAAQLEVQLQAMMPQE